MTCAFSGKERFGRVTGAPEWGIMMENRYQLRYAAGSFWLLDMEQSGRTYRKPIALNESGANIWKLLQEGKTTDWIAKELADSCGIPVKEAGEDVLQFIEQLKGEGILLPAGR